MGIMEAFIHDNEHRTENRKQLVAIANPSEWRPEATSPVSTQTALGCCCFPHSSSGMVLLYPLLLWSGGAFLPSLPSPSSLGQRSSFARCFSPFSSLTPDSGFFAPRSALDVEQTKKKLPPDSAVDHSLHPGSPFFPRHRPHHISVPT